MMHPHIAKLLADAHINEVRATAERHRWRRLARHRGHGATEGTTADHSRENKPTVPTGCRPLEDFERHPDRDDKGQYVEA
jgi:hypothetical protein